MCVVASVVYAKFLNHEHFWHVWCTKYWFSDTGSALNISTKTQYLKVFSPYFLPPQHRHLFLIHILFNQAQAFCVVLHFVRPDSRTPSYTAAQSNMKWNMHVMTMVPRWIQCSFCGSLQARDPLTSIGLAHPIASKLSHAQLMLIRDISRYEKGASSYDGRHDRGGLVWEGDVRNRCSLDKSCRKTEVKGAVSRLSIVHFVNIANAPPFSLWNKRNYFWKIKS